MNFRVLKILISSGIILVFTAFNVGIPVVISLCPMMDDSADRCDMMSSPKQDVLSFTSEIPDCCTSHIIAERNTIPYLSVEQFKVSHLLHLDLVAHAASDAYLVHGQFLLTEVTCLSPSPPFTGPVSLSILNSTLLI